MTPAQQTDQRIAEMERPFTVATPQGPTVDWVRMVDTDKELFKQYIFLRELARLKKIVGGERCRTPRA